LDVLSGVFGDECLEHLLPVLQTTLSNESWEIKESGILAIGAIAEGCMTGMSPHLGSIIPFLINALNDSKALVRSIACWTLSRYCHYAMQPGQEETFKQLLNQLLARILDNNKRVQEAACSAFATFEEEACNEIVPYLYDIVRTFVEAFKRYQAKNLLILYDAVGTLADSVADKLADPALSQMLMEPIMQKWATLTDEDREIYPLLECVSSIAMAMQKAFMPYTPPVFERCVYFIENTLNKALTAGLAANRLREEIGPNGPTEAQLAEVKKIDTPEKDVLIVAIDLLSELTEALGENIQPLVGANNSKLIQLLYFCVNDPNVEVRQSAFALLGDLAKTCYPLVQPFVHLLIPVMATNINPDNISVCNNSIWAIGEIAMRLGTGISPFLQQILGPLVLVMTKDRPAAKTLQENCAITLGRLGLHCSADLAPYLPQFIRPWCLALRNIRDNSEKESAFYGMCLMIDQNPNGIADHFIFLCDAIVSWNAPPDQLKAMFTNILQVFYRSVGPETWNAFVTQFPNALRERLQQQYNL
jgi:transportin-1